MEGMQSDGTVRQSAVVAVLNSRYEQDRMLMQMLQCLFFNEAQCQCTIVASHIPGQHNDLADDLSRNWANIFLSKRLTPVGYLPSFMFLYCSGSSIPPANGPLWPG